MLRVYNCSVRLGGSVLHTVPKIRITGEEVRLLKHLHGDDSIVDLKEIGSLKEDYTRDMELMDLASRYSTDNDHSTGRKLVEKVFNTTLADFDGWLMRKEQEAEDHEAQSQVLRRMEETATAKGTLVRSKAAS